jgi:hypothetical protein
VTIHSWDVQVHNVHMLQDSLLTVACVTVGYPRAASNLGMVTKGPGVFAYVVLPCTYL